MLPSRNTLSDLYRYADLKWDLTAHDESEKMAMKRILAEDLFACTGVDFLFPEEKRFSESEILHWMNAVKRIANHEPLQYVTGKASFFGLLLDVNPSVLIPRPETEELVLMALDNLSASEIHVLDCCTGSGCIALALKSKRADWKVSALDISEAALQTAKKNAEQLNLAIDFFHSDVLAENPLPDLKWDLIISNPPYVAISEKASMETHVLAHEPHLALFVEDEDPLIFYRRLAGLASKHLNPGGKMMLELNPLYAQETAAVFLAYGLNTMLYPDMQGKERMLLVSI